MAVALARGHLRLSSLWKAHCFLSFNLCSQCLQDAARTRLREARPLGSLMLGCLMLGIARTIQGERGLWREQPRRWDTGAVARGRLGTRRVAPAYLGSCAVAEGLVP